MTTTIGSSSTSLADRRRASLERQYGTDQPRTQARGERRRAPIRPTLRRTIATDAPKRERRSLRSALGLVADPATSSSKRTLLGPPPGTFYAIAAVVGIFVVLGLVMVLSASAIVEANAGNSPYGVFGRQAMWALLGLVGLVFAAVVPYTVWKRFAIPLGLLGVAAMALPLVPGIGVEINGARAWVRIGGFSMQPSEFLKLVVVIAAADLLTRRANVMGDNRRALIPAAVLAGAAALMSIFQGDLGSAIVLGAIVLSVAWIAGAPLAPLAGVAAIAAVGAIGFIATSARRIDRFTAFLDVEGHKTHESFQVYQSFVSIANGGLTGSGIGGSRAKLGYLPLPHSDFIFAVIVDELGMIGTSVVIGGFLVLVGFGVQASLAAPDRFGMLLAGGISAWFGVQAIINLGGVTGVLPVTGLTLPFFSAGGSSLFVSMFAAGLLLSVARRAAHR